MLEASLKNNFLKCFILLINIFIITANKMSEFIRNICLVILVHKSVRIFCCPLGAAIRLPTFPSFLTDSPITEMVILYREHTATQAAIALNNAIIVPTTDTH
jgi:hypothetical protein